MKEASAAPLPSARSIVKRQQRIATLVSLITALLLMALIGLILAVILMTVNPVGQPSLVSYSGVSEPEQKIKQPKIQTNVQRKPAAPSMAAAKILAANTESPTSIPVPQIEVEEVSIDIGVGDDFGAGWGDGEGFGNGGGSTFFGQTSTSERLAYVIDYSASMRSQGRDQIMRKELSRSLQKMQNGLQIGMIFFAGPAWVAGDKVKMIKQKEAVVDPPKGKNYKWKTTGGANGWQPDGPKQKAPWWEIGDREVKRLQKIVNETKLVWGTIWHHPIHMALDMDPPPQTIYFMTDGSASGSAKWAQEVGKRAKKMGVIINCVALMHPKAKADLKTIAEMTGGMLTMVDANGKREEIK